jgi:hypothetical protein
VRIQEKDLFFSSLLQKNYRIVLTANISEAIFNSIRGQQN